MNGQIIKISGGSITEVANSDLLLKAENIDITAAVHVNETADNGIFFD